MTVKPIYRTLVCECCANLIANGDDSACRDYHEHDHDETNLGLERNENAVLECSDPAGDECDDERHDHNGIRYFDCAGCGQGPIMGQPFTVIVLADY